jgi:hypothetical protein
MTADPEIPGVQALAVPTPTVTQAALARMTQAAILMTFAEANLLPFADGDYNPNTAAVDWESPKASLLRHPAVAKTVRIVASTAAQSQSFELRNFERFFLEKYLTECLVEASQTTDPVRKQKLESCVHGEKMYHNATHACRAELLDYARTYRRNVEFGVTSLINFCRGLVGEWLEFLPAESMRRLQLELENLATDSLSARLAWFGLTDFAPAGELPEN